jgi:peptide/nickel transport system substrate-binding protein
MWSSTRLWAAALVVGSLGLACTPAPAAPAPAATSSSAATTPATGGTLVVGDNFSVLSMDPARTVSNTSMNVLHAAYDSLTTYDGADLKTPKPNLASSWQVSPDGLTYTFTLRSDVKFESGNPLTSADVKWSLERLANVKGIAAFYVASVASIEAPDPQHVVVTLNAPNSGMLAILSAPPTAILDSKLVKEKGADATAAAKDADKAETYLNSHSAGSGPYVMTSYTPNQEVTLERNKAYWGTAPFYDRIVIRHQAEPATEKLQLERGDIQIALGLGQDQTAALKDTAGVTTATAPTATTFFVMFNTNPELAGPFANPKVREAVRYALDYDGIMKIAGPGAVRLAGAIPALLPGALDPTSAPKQDKDKAKQLLAESGVSPLSAKLSIGSDFVFGGLQFSILGQKIQSDLQAVGIDTTIDGRPLPAWKADYIGGKLQMTAAVYAADWPDPSNFLVFSPDGSVSQRAQWAATASPDAKALFDLGNKAQAEVDAAKRAQLYQQFDTQLQQVGPYIPLFQPATPIGYRSDLKGVVYNTTWAVDYRAVGK